MASTSVAKKQSSPQHHHACTIISSLFGFIALGLIIVSILVLWLSQTLTNTDVYVKTVTPLVSEPAVQDFVVEKARTALLENEDIPIRDVAGELLGPQNIGSKADEELKTEVVAKVESSLRSVLGSEAFATLWAENNRAIHSQLVSQLNSNSPTIVLNFNPLITGVVDQLSATDLAFIKDKVEIKPDVGQITIKGDQLHTVRSVSDYFNKALLAILVCALLSLVLCVLISVHHTKTLRRIGVATGIFALILFVLLSATSLFDSSSPDAAVAFAVVNAVTSNLRVLLLVVAITCLGVAIGSKVYDVAKSKQKSTTTRK